MFFTQLQCLCIYTNPIEYFKCNKGEDKILSIIITLADNLMFKKGGEISRTIYALSSILLCYGSDICNQLPQYVTNQLVPI
jgi:hypothetical protein